MFNSLLFPLLPVWKRSYNVNLDQFGTGWWVRLVRIKFQRNKYNDCEFVIRVMSSHVPLRVKSWEIAEWKK